MEQSFKKNQLVWLELDQSLGVARIVDDSDPQFIQIEILENKERRNYIKRNPPLKRAQLYVGQKIKVIGCAEEITVDKVELKNDLYLIYTSNGIFLESDIVALIANQGLVDLLKQNKFSHPKLYSLRNDAWDLWSARNIYPLKGAAGCRVQLLPHQVFVLERALQEPTIRALLADEVGLGKTIEAGLIFSTLHARRELKRVLILVPSALKVQWLTECYRRFNVRFRLDHEELIEEDEYREFVIASLDEIDQNNLSFDLLIVDEAHRLSHDVERSAKLENIVRKSKHVLFLSATPWIYGKEEFSKMMKILGSYENQEIKTLVFQSKRSELGLKAFRSLEAVYVENKQDWLFSFLKNHIESHKNKKIFLIGSKVEDVKKIHAELRNKLGEKFACFHEEMDLVERDRQAAYFADPEGAQFLVSSEIGGEGRNFQFCQDMLLLDIPHDPLVLEQRIGRLDRIGQTETVRVWCPVLPDEEQGFEKLRDKYQVFEKPWSGSGFDDNTEIDDSNSADSDYLSLEKEKFDLSMNHKWIDSLKDFSETPICDVLDKIYNVFGVEVEDFDSKGNWHIQASSLMFVDYFPGLDDLKEKTLTFDREQALVREEMTFYSIDHPDFVESLEFFLNSDQGKLSISRLAEGSLPDVYLKGLFRDKHSSQLKSKLWSVSRAQESHLSLKSTAEAVNIETIPIKFFEALEEALQPLMATEPHCELDALQIFIP